MTETSIDFDRLIKVMGRLDSPHEGEVVIAARKTVQILKTANLTFDDLKPGDEFMDKVEARRKADDLLEEILELHCHMHQVDEKVKTQEAELARLKAENAYLQSEVNQHLQYVDRIDARKQKWQEKAFDAVKLARELSGRVIELEEGLTHLSVEQPEHLI